MGWDIFAFSSETAERNSTKLEREQDLNSSTKFVFFGMIEKKKTKLTALASYWLRHFRFSSESTERNSTKLDRKQNLNVFFYYVCVLQTIGKQDSRLASDWLRHLRLLLWNHLKEFNEAWQETRSQLPYQVCVFRADKKNQRWPHWPLIGWDIFDFSCETTERNSTKLGRKQDLIVFFYKVCVLRTDRKTRWPPWPLIGWHIFDFSCETTERNSTNLGRKQDRIVFFYKVCVLRTDRKTRWPPWPLIGWHFFYFTSESTELNSTKFDSNRDPNSSIKFFFGLIG